MGKSSRVAVGILVGAIIGTLAGNAIANKMNSAKDLQFISSEHERLLKNYKDLCNEGVEKGHGKIQFVDNRMVFVFDE
jgi:hypothetical protein